jgi:hypothetical protein
MEVPNEGRLSQRIPDRNHNREDFAHAVALAG